MQLACMFKLSDVKENSQQELSSESRIIIRMTTFVSRIISFFLPRSHLPHLSSYHPPIHMLLLSLPPLLSSQPLI